MPEIIPDNTLLVHSSKDEKPFINILVSLVFIFFEMRFLVNPHSLSVLLAQTELFLEILIVKH